MVVNIASLPSTDTFVTELGRSRGPGAGALCGGRACALAAVGRSATIDALNTIVTPTPVARPCAVAASTTPGQQLAFPGITAASRPTRNNRTSHS